MPEHNNDSLTRSAEQNCPAEKEVKKGINRDGQKIVGIKKSFEAFIAVMLSVFILTILCPSLFESALCTSREGS
jgi:hypothetical protein